MQFEGEKVKNYLNPKIVSKLNSLELIAKVVVEGFMVGLHRSPYHGFSAEFSEHRSYQQGDPLRDIDWKVYARSGKYFIKQYEEETNLISHVILDISNSMDYKSEGSISKFDYARILAASLCYLTIHQQDSTGLVLYSDKLNSYISPRSNRIHLRTLLTTLNNSKPGSSTSTAECLGIAANKIKKRGLVIIISDFLDNKEQIIKSFKQFHVRNNEVIVFHLLDPKERNFDFNRDTIFVDKESSEEIKTSPVNIRNAYKNHFKKYLEFIKMNSLSAGIDYNLITTDMPFDKALLNYFNKRNKLN